VPEPSWPTILSPTSSFIRSMPVSHLMLPGKPSGGCPDRAVPYDAVPALEAYCLIRDAPRPLVAPMMRTRDIACLENFGPLYLPVLGSLGQSAVARVPTADCFACWLFWWMAWMVEKFVGCDLLTSCNGCKGYKVNELYIGFARSEVAEEVW
jgi:hypothetical protein